MGKDLTILTVAQVMSGNLIKGSDVSLSNPQRTTPSRLVTLINNVTYLKKMLPFRIKLQYLASNF